MLKGSTLAKKIVHCSCILLCIQTAYYAKVTHSQYFSLLHLSLSLFLSLTVKKIGLLESVIDNGLLFLSIRKAAGNLEICLSFLQIDFRFMKF